MGRVADDIKSWSRTASTEDKVKMLRTLAETLGELERSGEQLNEKEWDRRFREAQETARTESKSAVHAIETLMRSKTALAAAERRALAASLRPKTGGGSGNSKGETLWQDWIKKNEPGSDQNMADPGSRMNPAKALDTMIADLRSADFLRAEDKARPYLTQRVLDSGIITPKKLREAIGEEMWQAYLDGKDSEAGSGARAAAAADRLEAGTFTAPDLDALKDEALRHANVDEKDVPRKEREKSDLEKSLAAQMEELNTSTTAGPGRWWGLTDAEVGDLVSRPGFQRWAKAHGLTDLGYVNNAGDFVIGGETAKAIKLAMHQTARKPKPEFGGEFGGNVFTPKSPEPLFTRGGVTNGKINSVWLTGDDGRIDYLDLDSGTLTPAKDALGNWKSTALRDTFEKHKAADPEPHPYGIKGQPAWTYDQIKAHGPIDVVKDTAVTSDPKELLDLPTPTTNIKGRLRKPMFGEDPDLDAEVEQADGTLVRLHRTRTDAPWTVEEGSGKLYVAPDTIEITKTKVVRPKAEKDLTLAALRKARRVEEPAAKKAEPEVTDAEVAAFTFPGRRAEMSDEERAAALTPKGEGVVTVEEGMDPEERARIMHKVDAELLGAQLQEGGERMVESAKRDKSIAADVATAAAAAKARPRPAIPTPVVAVPEETEVVAVDSPALRADEAAFEKRLAEKKAVHDLGDTDIVVRPEPTEMVDGQEVPVRITPKTDAERRADAMKRARQMAAAGV